MKEKFKAAGLHFLLSLVLISFVFCLIYFIWYPAPFYQLSGGRDLIELIFGVDLVLGPLLTLVAFNKKKTFRHNFMDISVIACVQLAALGYGLYTVFQARPVFMVFEYYRFHAVHANEIDPEHLQNLDINLSSNLPIWRLNLLGLRKPAGADAQFNSVTLAINGVPEAAQPNLWIPYDEVTSQVLAESKPISALLQRFPGRAEEIKKLLKDNNLSENQAIYVPAIIKKSFWTIVLDKSNLTKLHYLNLDSFE